MSRRYKFHNPEGLYFVTFAVQHWIDVFTRSEYKNILVENLDYCQKYKGLEIFAWVIMTNHVHLIIRAKDSFLLQNIMRDFKTYTSKIILNAIEENIQESRREWLLRGFLKTEGNRFWQPENRPIELWSNEVIEQKLNYIHQNPVEEGIVYKAEQYVYSSAADYAGEKGMLEISIIE